MTEAEVVDPGYKKKRITVVVSAKRVDWRDEAGYQRRKKGTVLNVPVPFFKQRSTRLRPFDEDDPGIPGATDTSMKRADATTRTGTSAAEGTGGAYMNPVSGHLVSGDMYRTAVVGDKEAKQYQELEGPLLEAAREKLSREKSEDVMISKRDARSTLGAWASAQRRAAKGKK